MTAFIALILLSVTLLIFYLFQIIGLKLLSSSFVVLNLLSLGIGLLILIYITIPLMEWSGFFNILFWIISITQLIVILAFNITACIMPKKEQ